MSFFGSLARLMNSSNSEARWAVVALSRPYMRPTKVRYSLAVSLPKRAMPSGTTPMWRLTSMGLEKRS